MNKRYQNRKSKARMLALQAIYQWQSGENKMTDILIEFNQSQRDFSKVFFSKLIIGVSENYQSLDELFNPLLDRKIESLDLVEKALLRLSSFELVHCPESPTKVVIDEAIYLAKEFAGDKSYKFINAVLDKLSQNIDRKQAVFTEL